METMRFRVRVPAVCLAATLMVFGCGPRVEQTGETAAPPTPVTGTTAVAPKLTNPPTTASQGKPLIITGTNLYDDSSATLVFFVNTVSPYNVTVVSTSDNSSTQSNTSITVTAPSAGTYDYYLETSHGNGIAPTPGSTPTPPTPSNPSVTYPITIAP